MIRRITYIHQHYQLPSEGGAMRGWEFTRRLVQDGYDVTVIRGSSKEQSGTFEGVRVIGAGTPYSNDMSIPRRLIAFLQFTARASILSLRIPTDLVFATSTPLTVAIPGIIASTVKRTPFVFEVRDLWPRVPIELGYLKNPVIIKVAKMLEKITYRKAQSIVALSPGMRDGVLEVFGKANVIVVPNAADIELFDPFKSQRDQIRKDLNWGEKIAIVYAGSFGDIYNIPWIIELASYSRNFAEFQIIGKGKNTTESQELATQLGFNASIMLPGSMSKPDVAKRVVAADFCISSVVNHPSLEPASINKVFDAMAAGRPILFNHDGWLTELCVRKGAGWRLPDNPSDASDFLSNIVASPENIDRASRESRKLAEEFSRESLYIDFKRSLLDRSDAELDKN